MIKRRRRFKQTVPFTDRLMIFAQDLRKVASLLPAGKQRDDLMARARAADTAVALDELIRSHGSQSAKEDGPQALPRSG
jgi:hypothetical protein